MSTPLDQNTSKTRTFWAACVAGVTGVLSYIALVPPDQQASFIGQLTELFPHSVRADVGGILRLVSGIATLYAVSQASKSGPQTPPKNSSSE